MLGSIKTTKSMGREIIGTRESVGVVLLNNSV